MLGRWALGPSQWCLTSTSVSVEGPSSHRATLGLSDVGEGLGGLRRCIDDDVLCQVGSGSTILHKPQKTPQSPSFRGPGGILTEQFVLPGPEQEHR